MILTLNNPHTCVAPSARTPIPLVFVDVDGNPQLTDVEAFIANTLDTTERVFEARDAVGDPYGYVYAYRANGLRGNPWMLRVVTDERSYYTAFSSEDDGYFLRLRSEDGQTLICARTLLAG